MAKKRLGTPLIRRPMPLLSGQSPNKINWLAVGGGMPPLPDLVYGLYIRKHGVNATTRQIFDNLKARPNLAGG